jgi:hypothetical protein
MGFPWQRMVLEHLLPPEQQHGATVQALPADDPAGLVVPKDQFEGVMPT